METTDSTDSTERNTMETLTNTLTDRACPTCGKIITYPTKSGYSQAVSRKASCKNCYEKEYRRNNKDKFETYKPRLKGYHRNRTLNKSYNIDVEQYKSMSELQNNSCAICKKHQSEFKHSLCVDHCHSTGMIRGLLCHSCNLLLGNAGDDIVTLEKSIEYLKQYGKN